MKLKEKKSETVFVKHYLFTVFSLVTVSKENGNDFYNQRGYSNNNKN